MNQQLIKKIKYMKRKYEPEGFIILGVFGSYSRSEQTKESDIDILFEMNSDFMQKYSGWDAYARIEYIKDEMYKLTGQFVDLADKNGLNRIGKKYILPEVVYV